MNKDPRFVHFEEYHIPDLKSGTYKLSLKQTVAGQDSKAAEIQDSWSSQQLIHVASERYTLSPADIFAVFPPQGNIGEHENVLPHISFNRASLPWERLVQPIPDGVSLRDRNRIESYPWMGLLLFDEDELEKEVVSLPEPIDLAAARDLAGLAEEPGDADLAGQKVNIIKARASWLKTVLATETDMKWLSHVRSGCSDAGIVFERPTLIGNRFPKAGRKNFVHLVSLENRFNSDHEFDFEMGQSEDGTIALISLHAWNFSCPDTETFRISTEARKRLQTLIGNDAGKFDAINKNKVFRGKTAFSEALIKHNLIAEDTTLRDSERFKKILKACHYEMETFKGLLNHLSKAPFRFALSPDEHDAIIPSSAQAFLDIGSLPLPHNFRYGGKAVSWYRGPLMPIQKGQEPQQAQGLEQTQSAEKINLPARNADQLLRYDKNSGMLDTSYAAAWEVGRLLMLKNMALSKKLYYWKHKNAQDLKHSEQLLSHQHLPILNSAEGYDSEEIEWQPLSKYFSDLNLLKGVPFQYLVPDESYLPPESVRLFQIDPVWLDCLADGAFSIGRVTKFDHQIDNDGGAESELRNLTGLLIRSEAVSGWPALTVEAYDKTAAARDPVEPKTNLFTVSTNIEQIVESLDHETLPERLRAKLEQIISEFSGNVDVRKEAPFIWRLIDHNAGHFIVSKGRDETLHVYRQNQLNVLRREKLSPNVLLCIFDGLLEVADFHLPPEALHFGFARPFGEHKDYFKELKNPETAQETGEIVDISWRNQLERCLNASGMAAATLAASQTLKDKYSVTGEAGKKTFTSAQFAIEMIEGIPKVRFEIKN